jgi:hypothetical protein
MLTMPFPDGGVEFMRKRTGIVFLLNENRGNRLIYRKSYAVNGLFTQNVGYSTVRTVVLWPVAIFTFR